MTLPGWSSYTAHGLVVSWCGICDHWLILDGRGGWVHENQLNNDHDPYPGYVIREDRELTDRL